MQTGGQHWSKRNSPDSRALHGAEAADDAQLSLAISVHLSVESGRPFSVFSVDEPVQTDFAIQESGSRCHLHLVAFREPSSLSSFLVSCNGSIRLQNDTF